MSSHLHRILQCSQGACDDDGTFEDEGCRGIVTGPIAGQDTLIVASIKSHIADKDALERWVCSVVSKLTFGVVVVLAPKLCVYPRRVWVFE